VKGGEEKRKEKIIRRRPFTNTSPKCHVARREEKTHLKMANQQLSYKVSFNV